MGVFVGLFATSPNEPRRLGVTGADGDGDEPALRLADGEAGGSGLELAESGDRPPVVATARGGS
ncbi:hypothetical protein GCM10012280_30570 [Wenjunlia tyrosinilytica]|uniref:Uncharacterized protein n=1 Tax=Wenjunlia tyrosinilytica TaxID=1544741 RepID=A0A917ZRW0_9ACTN|nr:hypothetical protein GCM10012280_30570 [Wenjunlia tyrosinilytica]